MRRAVRFVRNVAAVSGLLYAAGLALGTVLSERYQRALP